MRDQGQIECIDPAHGRSVWNGALPRDAPSHYAAREDSVVFVARVGGPLEILSKNDMGGAARWVTDIDRCHTDCNEWVCLRDTPRW